LSDAAACATRDSAGRTARGPVSNIE